MDRQGFHFEISNGEIYFVIAVSLGVEILNLKILSKRGATPTPNESRHQAGKASAHPPVRRDFLTPQEANGTVHCGLRNRGERLTGKKVLV